MAQHHPRRERLAEMAVAVINSSYQLERDARMLTIRVALKEKT